MQIRKISIRIDFVWILIDFDLVIKLFGNGDGMETETACQEDETEDETDNRGNNRGKYISSLVLTQLMKTPRWDSLVSWWWENCTKQLRDRNTTKIIIRVEMLLDIKDVDIELEKL